MSAFLLDGRTISEKILYRIQQQCELRARQHQRVPSLAVIMLGDNPASTIYVRNKEQACKKVGFNSVTYKKRIDFGEANLLDLIAQLNTDEHVDGILVQLPLPTFIDTNKVLEAIVPTKDVDGFHPYNMGRLAVKRPALRPCTPKGVMLLLAAYAIDVKGKHAVIVGQSNIVGRPMALELLQQKATVTVCHSATNQLSEEIKRADIVVAAIGQAQFIQAQWLKPGAVVIDIGINRLQNGQLVGDVDFVGALTKASYITPVPGGIGPMTIASLLDNTLIAASSKDE